MGQSLSSSKAKEAAPTPPPTEGKFGVRVRRARPPPLANHKREAFPFTLRQMTPALIESTGAASGGQAVGQAVDGAVTLSPEEHNELLQRAFKEGARPRGKPGPVWPGCQRGPSG